MGLAEFEDEEDAAADGKGAESERAGNAVLIY
jgi:hypothetical protein